MNTFKRFCFCLAAMWIASPLTEAGDKSVMHCFAWTPVKEATPADWDAFYKASDALPAKIKGIRRVWYGKLAAPLGQTAVVKMDDPTFDHYNAGDVVTGD